MIKIVEEASIEACRILRAHYIGLDHPNIVAYDDAYVIRNYPLEWSLFMDGWKFGKAIEQQFKNNKMSKFKTEIKIATSSKSKLVFVKVPDSLNDLSVNNTSNEVTGTVATIDGTERWTSEKIPNQYCKFIGYSHKLTDEEIENIFSSRAEFYQMCNQHKILYNYSAYTGKWAVLTVA